MHKDYCNNNSTKTIWGIMYVYGGVWCQTGALTTLVTITMIIGVIDEGTDGSIILAYKCFHSLNNLANNCEKYIILMRSRVKVRRVYSQRLSHGLVALHYLLFDKVCGS